LSVGDTGDIRLCSSKWQRGVARLWVVKFFKMKDSNDSTGKSLSDQYCSICTSQEVSNSHNQTVNGSLPWKPIVRVSYHLNSITKEHIQIRIESLWFPLVVATSLKRMCLWRNEEGKRFLWKIPWKIQIKFWGDLTGNARTSPNLP
jgi:hypothetical protein